MTNNSLWSKYGKKLTEIYGVYSPGFEPMPVCHYCGIHLMEMSERRELAKETAEYTGETIEEFIESSYLDFGIPTVDHIVPVSKGGTDDIENLVPCCKSCNSKKNNRDRLTVYMRSEPLDMGMVFTDADPQFLFQKVLGGNK